MIHEVKRYYIEGHPEILFERLEDAKLSDPNEILKNWFFRLGADSKTFAGIGGIDFQKHPREWYAAVIESVQEWVDEGKSLLSVTEELATLSRNSTADESKIVVDRDVRH